MYTLCCWLLFLWLLNMHARKLGQNEWNEENNGRNLPMLRSVQLDSCEPYVRYGTSIVSLGVSLIDWYIECSTGRYCIRSRNLASLSSLYYATMYIYTSPVLIMCIGCYIMYGAHSCPPFSSFFTNILRATIYDECRESCESDDDQYNILVEKKHSYLSDCWPSLCIFFYTSG